MADTKLSALTAASALDGTELYYASQSAADRKVTGAQIQTLVGFSNEAVQDMIATFLAAGSGVTLAYNDAGNALTITSSVPWLKPLAGRFYLPFGVTTAASAVLAANSICFIPFAVYQTMTISDIGTRITTTAAGGNIQLAIYANDQATNKPTGTALLSTGNLSTTSSLNVSQGGFSVQLTPGIYWMAVNADATAAATTQVLSLAAANPWTSSLVGATSLSALITSSTVVSVVYTFATTFNTWPDMTGQTIVEVSANLKGALIAYKVASVP